MDAQIRMAIRERRLIEFNYHGLRRGAEPHVYGILEGKYQLLVFQVAGQSASGGLPNWRRVDLDELSDLRVLEDTFVGPRPWPSGRHSSFDTVLAVVE